MIIDLGKFVASEEVYWKRLDAILKKRADDPWTKLTLEEIRELDYLYRRTSADLAKVATFSAEETLKKALENRVARAYAEIYGSRKSSVRFNPWLWLVDTFPSAVRRHSRALWLAFAITFVGAVFGGVAVLFDPEVKSVVLPFSHLMGDPKDRVAEEEAAKEDRLDHRKASFGAELMTHNTQVTIFAAALGLAWGVGTVILVFYNGVILGVVALDYLQAGQAKFLFGWLLPHGVIEIPAILIGAQAGFVLAKAVIGRDDGSTVTARLKKQVPDVGTLILGAALMLVWAGIMESYFSQYHKPRIAYDIKILVGVGEAIALGSYLALSKSKGKKA